MMMINEGGIKMIENKRNILISFSNILKNKEATSMIND